LLHGPETEACPAADGSSARLCYDSGMKNRDSAGKRREGARGVTVGRERFGKMGVESADGQTLPDAPGDYVHH